MGVEGAAGDNAGRLTPREREILAHLQAAEDSGDDYEAEIVCDGGQCWMGSERLRQSTVDSLLRKVCLSHNNLGGADHYTINGTGREALKDESVIDRVQAAMAGGGNVDSRGYPIGNPLTDKKTIK